MSDYNKFLSSISPLCAFEYNGDKICVIEYSDFCNPGYIDGWLFVFNTKPYFYSVAGGSERITNNLAETYAFYLAEMERFNDVVKEEDLDGGTTWKLDDDDTMTFREAFAEAMIDMGFVHTEEGGFERRNWKTTEELLDYVAETGMREQAQIVVDDEYNDEGEIVFFTYKQCEQYEVEPDTDEDSVQQREEILRVYADTRWIILEQ